MRNFTIIDRSLTIFFFLYLASFFLLPYTPNFLPFSIHTMALGAFLPFAIVARWRDWRKSFTHYQIEVAIGSIAFGSFLISALFVHGAAVGAANVRAPILGFASYLFLRLTGPSAEYKHLFHFFIFYLLASAALAFFQIYGGPAFYPSAYLGSPPGIVYATAFSNFSNYGAALIMFALATLCARICLVEWGHTPWLLALAIGAGTIGLYFTLSRAGLLGLGVGLALLCYAVIRLGKSLRRYCALVATIGALIVFSVAIPAHRIDYYKQIRFTVDPSVLTRVETIKTAMKAMAEHPYWGVGPGQFSSYYKVHYQSLPFTKQVQIDPSSEVTAHNAFLEYGSELGLIPLFALLLLVGLICLRNINAIDSENAPMWVGFVSVLTWLMFHGSIGDRLFWISLALAAASPVSECIRDVTRQLDVRFA